MRPPALRNDPPPELGDRQIRPKFYSVEAGNPTPCPAEPGSLYRHAKQNFQPILMQAVSRPDTDQVRPKQIVNYLQHREALGSFKSFGGAPNNPFITPKPHVPTQPLMGTWF